ncbi:hypothetical protein [Sphingomonas faeni]|uniref:hypothetical protein n=1 Tax=Sphingomonas faeni TaxID=185950 RepID=UPI003353CC91
MPKGSNEREEVVLDAHRSLANDYVTTHIWPRNWSRMKAGDLAKTYEGGAADVGYYIASHECLARNLDKPLVIEEFGCPRDGFDAFDPSIPTTYEDRFYDHVHAAIEADVAPAVHLPGRTSGSGTARRGRSMRTTGSSAVTWPE